MSRWKWFVGLVVLLGLGIGWYLFRPELLLINQRVNEEFPSSATAAARVVARGQFRSVAHETKGTATVHRLADGRRVLRLTDFETSNGPAVRVYLVDAADAADHDTVKRARVLDLGVLKGNVGDQNYEVPADADLSAFRAVTIWCHRFSVNFGTAPLTPPEV